MHYFRTPVPAKLESLAEFGTASVGSFDASTNTAQVVQYGLSIGNGIALSRDKRKLYVVNTVPKDINTYDVHSIENITLADVTHVGTCLDNLQVDPEDGSIWIGSHPVPIKIILYLDDQENLQSPSQVLRVKVDGKGHPRSDAITEVYVDQGQQISGSTVALRYKKQLLIGSISDKTVLCELDCFEL